MFLRKCWDTYQLLYTTGREWKPPHYNSSGSVKWPQPTVEYSEDFRILQYSLIPRPLHLQSWFTGSMRLQTVSDHRLEEVKAWEWGHYQSASFLPVLSCASLQIVVYVGQWVCSYLFRCFSSTTGSISSLRRWRSLPTETSSRKCKLYICMCPGVRSNAPQWWERFRDVNESCNLQRFISFNHNLGGWNFGCTILSVLTV